MRFLCDVVSRFDCGQQQQCRGIQRYKRERGDRKKEKEKPLIDTALFYGRDGVCWCCVWVWLWSTAAAGPPCAPHCAPRSQGEPWFLWRILEANFRGFFEREKKMWIKGQYRILSWLGRRNLTKESISLIITLSIFFFLSISRSLSLPPSLIPLSL